MISTEPNIETTLTDLSISPSYPCQIPIPESICNNFQP
jgi:hypothetical protein